MEFRLNANAVFEAFFEVAFVNAVSVVARQFSFAVMLTVFELSFVHAAIEVFVTALSLDVAALELACVGSLVVNDVGSVTLELSILELAIVPVAVGKEELAVVAMVVVIHKVAFIYATIGKLNDPKTILFAVLELALEPVADSSSRLNLAVNLIIDPIASDETAVREGQLTLAMSSIILPHAFVFRLVRCVVNAKSLPDHVADELAAIVVGDLMIKLFRQDVGVYLQNLGTACGSKSAHGIG